MKNSSFKENCCNRLAETMKELDYRGIEINLEQCRCCSRCCSNPGAIKDWISHATTKRWRSKISKNGGYAPHTFGCPNFEL